MQCRVEVALLALSLLTFTVSFFGGFGATIDLGEEWRLIAILEANPNRYSDYIQDILFYFILLPAVGLTFSIIAFIKNIKSPTGILDEWWLLLAFIGGLFFAWGLLGLKGTYVSYTDAMRFIDSYDPMDIANLIPPIYATASVGFILWLFAGVLFMLSPVFKKMLHDKENMPKIKKNSL